uniref:Uncharacterized protein n=1 Tax=Panagrolaimus sp. ES5 TaxID=591445 RepID=A0AC34FC83_9BILA
MRQFIILFLFIFSVKALGNSHDDPLIETKDGPKTSHDLIKEIKEEHSKGIGASPLPSPDIVPSDAVKVAGVPSETNAGRPIVLDKPNVVPTTVPEKSGLPSENVAPANSKAEKIALAPSGITDTKLPEKRIRRSPDSSSSESHEIHTGVVAPAVLNPGLPTLSIAPNPPAGLGAGLRKRRDASKSSESDESDKDVKSDAFTRKVPTESVVVAKKEEGKDSIKVGSATKVESIAVTGSPEKENLPTIPTRIRRDNSKSSEEEKDSAFTTKVPIESVAVAKKKPGEDKAEIATATKVENVAVSGDPNEKNLPTVSPNRVRREADKSSEEKKEDTIVAAKVPTEEIAVAYKKAGEDTKIVTATKSSIVAVAEESRVRRHSEPNSKSNESGEEESAQSPSSPVINKDEIKEAAVAKIKPGESEPEIVAVATAPIHREEGSRVRRDEKRIHKAGPNESDMAAGDPVKLEAKPKSRARRYA